MTHNYGVGMIRDTRHDYYPSHSSYWQSAVPALTPRTEPRMNRDEQLAHIAQYNARRPNNPPGKFGWYVPEGESNFVKDAPRETVPSWGSDWNCPPRTYYWDKRFS